MNNYTKSLVILGVFMLLVAGVINFQAQQRERIDKISQILNKARESKPYYIKIDTECSNLIKSVCPKIIASKQINKGKRLIVESYYQHYKDISGVFDKMVFHGSPTFQLLPQARQVMAAMMDLQKSIHRDETLDKLSAKLKDEIAQMDNSIFCSNEALTEWEAIVEEYNKKRGVYHHQ